MLRIEFIIIVIGIQEVRASLSISMRQQGLLVEKEWERENIQLENVSSMAVWPCRRIAAQFANKFRLFAAID